MKYRQNGHLSCHHDTHTHIAMTAFFQDLWNPAIVVVVVIIYIVSQFLSWNTFIQVSMFWRREIIKKNLDSIVCVRMNVNELYISYYFIQFIWWNINVCDRKVFFRILSLFFFVDNDFDLVDWTLIEFEQNNETNSEKKKEKRRMKMKIHSNRMCVCKCAWVNEMNYGPFFSFSFRCTIYIYSEFWVLILYFFMYSEF